MQPPQPRGAAADYRRALDRAVPTVDLERPDGSHMEALVVLEAGLKDLLDGIESARSGHREKLTLVTSGPH